MLLSAFCRFAKTCFMLVMLTGATPFDGGTFRKAALDEIRRMIRETDEAVV